jgi:peroxiredoxin
MRRARAMAADVKSTPLADELARICAMDAPLGARLAAYADAMREVKSPFADEYDRIVERLRSGEAGAGAPRVGEEMPPFLLPAVDGRMVSLDELRARGPVVVSFNRGHWCPFCKIELRTLATAEREFADLDAQVVSIIPDRQPFSGRLAADLRNKILVLSDIDNSYAMSLGLTMWVGDPARELMVHRGLRLDQFQGNEAWFLPLPATFVVDAGGGVAARFVDANFRKRMEIDAILRALRALRS